MAKKKIRVVTASDDGLVAAINEGANNDAELKSLMYKDKAYKKQITAATPELEDGETSVRLLGENSEALVTVNTSFDIDTNDADFDTVKEAAEAGKLDGIIERKVVATISSDNLAAVRLVLGEAEFARFVTVQTNYSVDTAGYSEMEVSAESEMEAFKEALEGCVSEKTVKKVKFKKL